MAFLMALSTPIAVRAIETEKSVRSDKAVEALGPIEPIGAIHEFASEGTLESLSAEMSSLMRRAVADLALWLQLTEEAIDVLSVEVVEWPSTNLGCTQPRMMCAQVFSPECWYCYMPRKNGMIIMPMKGVSLFCGRI